MAKPNTRIVQRHGDDGWVSAQRLPCLLEVPRHRGAVEAEARGDLRHRLPRLVQRHHLFHQLRTQVAMDPPRWNGEGLAVGRDVGVGRCVSGKRLCPLALGLLDVLAGCAQCHIVLLGDLRVGQPSVEVVGHQLLDALPPEPHQEAALLEVRLWLGRPASSHCCLQRASGRHQRVAVSGVSLQDLRHVMLTRTLGSNSAAEGLFMFVARQRDDGGVVEVDGVEEGLAEHAADGVGRLVWSVRLF